MVGADSAEFVSRLSSRFCEEQCCQLGDFITRYGDFCLVTNSMNAKICLLWPISNFGDFLMCFGDFMVTFDRTVTFDDFEILLSLSYIIFLNSDWRSMSLMDFLRTKTELSLKKSQNSRKCDVFCSF